MNFLTKKKLVIQKDSKFNVGDFVILHNHGGVYTTYYDAFKYFQIDLSNAKNYNNRSLYSSGCNKNTYWIIKDIALHGSCNHILYHISNKYNEHLVVNDESIKIHKKASIDDDTMCYNIIPNLGWNVY